METKWVYDSKGKPIAFLKDDKVFTKSGRFLGRLDGAEVWHGSYKGEIVKDDRLLYKKKSTIITRGTPGVPSSPSIPIIPNSKRLISMPSGYRDLDL